MHDTCVTQKCSAAYNDTIDTIQLHQISESSSPWYLLITTTTLHSLSKFHRTMWSKFTFAAFVITLITHSKKFTVVHAQTLLQPRDTLSSQSNSTQDEILCRDYLASLSSANISDTYSDSGANLEHTIVARTNPRRRNPRRKKHDPPLRTSRPVNYIIVSPAHADNSVLLSSIMYTGSTQT